MADIAERIKVVKENIRAACERVGRDSREVKLLVVTKSADFEQIKEVIRLGCADLGENRVPQLKKVSSQAVDFLQSENNSKLPQKINWHMIGHLQRNKVKQAISLASLIHSVDTLRLAEEINSKAAGMELCPRVLLQVNASGEPQKYGVPVGAAIHLIEQIVTMPNIKVVGLMTMAPLTRDKDVVRSCFRRLGELFVEIKGERVVGPDFTELSMGMSGDYEIAIEEGATILRIGSAIFAG
ncbi:MAG: YggS family pyridoxal phosphate-dependent enzyme [Phycisphaerae bacterium]|nr:YggS family pyridoxal phosphate-dependent enzyme [Phycisphaerae bacterium]